MGAPQRRSSYAKKETREMRRGPIDGRRWWQPEVLEQGSDHRAMVVVRDCLKIRRRQRWREQIQILHAAMYGSVAIMDGFGIYHYSRSTAEEQEQLSLNVIANNCNAAKSKITKNEPKATFLTSGGDYQERKRAEGLEKYCEGVLYGYGGYRKSRMAFLHGTIWGRGIIKSFIRGHKNGKRRIDTRIIYPHQFIVDEAQSQLPEDLQDIYERRPRDRNELAQWAHSIGMEHGLPPNSNPAWGDGEPGEESANILRERVFRSSAGPEESRDVEVMSTCDQVMVYEAYHLPSSEDAGDGRYVVCLHDCVLLDVEWKYKRFPYSTVAWQDAPMGWHGVGIAQILTGIQCELNTLVTQIREGHHWIRGTWLKHASSEVIDNHINNDLANIITWSGTQAPVYYLPAIVAPEVYEHMKWLYQVSGELCGLSALFTSAQKPAGITAARALDTLDDSQTERFADQSKNYDDLILDLTEMILILSKEIAKTDRNFGTTTRDKKNATFLKWSDVDMDRDKIVMEVFATSKLASKPAARLQQVQEMMSSQIVDPDTGLDLLDFPDTEQYSRRRQGWRRCVESDIASIADDGVYRSPEPTYNLQATIPIVRDALNDLRDRGLEEDRLEMLRQYMQAVMELAKPPAPPPVPPGGPMPPGAPGAPPGAAPKPGGPLAPAVALAPPTQAVSPA